MRYTLNLIITGLISAVFLYIGITGIIKKVELTRHNTKTIGHVTDNIIHHGKRSTSYHPVIEFKTPDGQTFSFESSFSTSGGPKYAVGQPLEILYETANPQNAEINDPFTIWLGPGLLTVLGALFLIIPLMRWIKLKRGQ